MKETELTLCTFDPTTADENLREKVVTFWQEWQAEENPEDPVRPRDVVRTSLETLPQNPVFRPLLLLAMDDAGQIRGLSIVGFPREGGPSYESGKHAAYTINYVTPAWRRKGIGTAMLREGVRRMAAVAELTVVQGESVSPAGNEFARHFGGEQALLTVENRLYHRDIDWDLVARWRQEGPFRAPGVTIDSFEGLPGDKDIEEFSQIYSEVFNQQPLGELEGLESHYTPEKMREQEALMQRQGRRHTVKISREANGRISGVTDISYNPKVPERVGQLLTGVRPAYRGRGLGKWLKADMLAYIRRTYPDFQFIVTGNANENAPMLSINQRLGFKVHKQVTQFKVALPELQRLLGARRDDTPAG